MPSKSRNRDSAKTRIEKCKNVNRLKLKRARAKKQLFPCPNTAINCITAVLFAHSTNTVNTSIRMIANESAIFVLVYFPIRCSICQMANESIPYTQSLSSDDDDDFTELSPHFNVRQTIDATMSGKKKKQSNCLQIEQYTLEIPIDLGDHVRFGEHNNSLSCATESAYMHVNRTTTTVHKLVSNHVRRTTVSRH